MRHRRAGIRLVASDLDGTLLRGDGTVSPRTDRVLRRCHERGLVVVLVTGRPPRILRQRLGAWLAASGRSLHELVICANGAIVWDPAGDVVIRDRRLHAEVADRIVSEVRAKLPGLRLAMEAGLDWFHQGEEPVPITRDLHKLLLHHPDSPLDDVLALTAEVAGADAEATVAGDHWIEVGPAGVTKAVTLAELAADIGVAPGEAIAFGDMPNDLPMLAWAGHGVAVANAHPAVLAAADEVTASNDDDGVALVLERILGTGQVST
jgi:HAD superfamily hydrolase (TIGR01484 family)